MILIRVFTVVLLFFSITTAVDEHGLDPFVDPYASHMIRILPLGDSLSSCTGVKPSFRFAYLSYRRFLWYNIFKDHPEGEGCVTFVGSHKGCNLRVDMLTPGGATYPRYGEAAFGRTAQDTINKINASGSTYIATYNPHHVLMNLGTNDIFQGLDHMSVYRRLQQVVSLFPKSTKIWYSTLVGFNVGKLASKKKRPEEQERVVKQGTELGRLNIVLRTKPLCQPPRCTLVDAAKEFDIRSMLYDGIHPNEAGEKHIASVWYEALKPMLDLHYSVNCTRAKVLAKKAPNDNVAIPAPATTLSPTPSLVVIQNSSPEEDVLIDRVLQYGWYVWCVVTLGMTLCYVIRKRRKLESK